MNKKKYLSSCRKERGIALVTLALWVPRIPHANKHKGMRRIQTRQQNRLQLKHTWPLVERQESSTLHTFKLVPSNGSEPDTRVYKMTPRLQTSTSGPSYFLPWVRKWFIKARQQRAHDFMCWEHYELDRWRRVKSTWNSSGAAYGGDPQNVSSISPGWYKLLKPIVEAQRDSLKRHTPRLPFFNHAPKSAILMSIFSFKSKFSALRSAHRWYHSEREWSNQCMNLDRVMSYALRNTAMDDSKAMTILHSRDNLVMQNMVGFAVSSNFVDR
jgi:hypothetical protein